MKGMGIPHCCGQALELCFKVPGKEYVCLKCKALYEFFDGFKRIDAKDMTTEQKAYAKEHGWVIEEGAKS